MGRRQLHMLWPAGRRPDPEALRLPEGYVFRAATRTNVAGFRELMGLVELGQWDDVSLAKVRATVVPHGWRIVVHEPTAAVVATGMAQRGPLAEMYPHGYEVGWIAAHPEHGGRGLGRAITAAATTRLVDLGAPCVYLRTDDFRWPALKTYLALGFVPHLWADDMPERWQQVCTRIGWSYTPEAWPRTSHDRR